MRLAIIGRAEDIKEDTPFNERYHIDMFFKEIADQLDILLIPIISEKKLKEVEEISDGLIVTGSVNDVHPKYYNEVPIEGKEYIIDEFALVKNAVEVFSSANKPILGICAGIQELNVIFGGTLYQKIPNHFLRDGTMHSIKIEEDSFLYRTYNKKVLKLIPIINKLLKIWQKDLKLLQ